MYETPAWVIAIAQLFRALHWLARACWRHPRTAALILAVLVIFTAFGSMGVTVAVVFAALALLTWQHAHPASYARLVANPAQSWWRGRVYASRWHGIMSIAGLAVAYQGRQVMPELVTVSATRCVDRLVVQLVRGQSPADVADVSDGLAHGLRVHSCRVRVSRPGFVLLELVRRDTLIQVIPALPIPGR